MNPFDELSYAIRATSFLSSLPVPVLSSPKVEANKKVSSDKKNQSQASQISEKKSEADTIPTSSSKSFDRWSLQDPSSIKYGHFGGKSRTSGSFDKSNDSFYITTAINYTNGPGHMGHAYEGITADTIARYQRIKIGTKQTHFVTGADEHGQKIATTAEDQGVQPIELCNKYVTGFKVLNQRMLVTNDDYMRTTSERHKKNAKALWLKCAKNGKSDIYLSTYSGWYNVREELFVTELEAEKANFKDPVTDKPLKKVEEESYFFRMSAYQEKLIEHIESNPEFIQPVKQRNNILSRLRADKLRDLSISRTSFDWGIPVPEGFDAKHVMYVWFDALTNYLTGVNALGVDENDDDDLAGSFWPANVHIIGKDILWFHTVIWPTILMSANIPLPKAVFAHGFVNDKEGKKMGKSLGNVVNPHDMLDKYPVDTFRWYICTEATHGEDLSFSQESLISKHNADLCDTLGNLVHRATNLTQKYCNGVIPDVPPPTKLSIDFDSIRLNFLEKMDKYQLEGGAATVMDALRELNGYLTEQAPWHMKGDERAEERRIVVRTTLEALYALAHMLVPFIPVGATAIFTKLNTDPVLLKELKSDLRNLVAGTKVSVGDVLFHKLMTEEEKLDAVEAAKKKKDSYAEGKKRKMEKKANAVASSKAGQKNTVANNDQPEFTKIDIRVGKIKKVWNHPNADKIFCEEIDVAEDSGPRQIASGLRGHYELSDMQDKKVLVVCNLKPAKIAGFSSSGMVLAAKSEDGSKVELISPPEDSAIGERVFIEGLSGEPFSPAQVKKRKAWDSMAKNLKTGAHGVATWNGKEILTSAGKCAAASLEGVSIS